MLGMLLLCCTLELSQTVNSIVVGRVVDPDNAIVPTAAVTLTDQNTGAIRRALTDTSGVFRFPDVLPGTYDIFVQVPGFKAMTEHNVDYVPGMSGGKRVAIDPGTGPVAPVAYIGLYVTRHSNLSYDINALPLGTYFQPSSLDPTNGNKPLPDILLRTNFYGYNTINQYHEIGAENYNALNVQLQRRFSQGLALGAAYTFSKAMGVTAFTPDVASNHSWNYGNLSTNRPHNLQVNWSYDLPKTNTYIGKILGAVTDHWTFSGVASVQSGALYTPSFSFSSGTVPSYTGTSAVTARMVVVGNPYTNIPAGSLFNPSAFALPALGTTSPATPILGDMGGGGGLLELPHVTNFDMTMSKFVPVFGERRGLKNMVQAYNIFNHTEYSGLNSTIQFSPTTGVVSNPAVAGTPNLTLPSRILAFTLRFE
jgi:hypothetical protein